MTTKRLARDAARIINRAAERSCTVALVTHPDGSTMLRPAKSWSTHTSSRPAQNRNSARMVSGLGPRAPRTRSAAACVVVGGVLILATTTLLNRLTARP
jgi:hypothetical protein